jgi:hypothetical protein
MYLSSPPIGFILCKVILWVLIHILAEQIPEILPDARGKQVLFRYPTISYKTAPKCVHMLYRHLLLLFMLTMNTWMDDIILNSVSVP